LTFTAVVQPDGVIKMHAIVQYPSDDGGPLRLGAPTLGSVEQLQLDGSPRSSSGENVELDPRGATSTIDYVVQGAVERYSDGAIVTLPAWTAPNGVSADDVRVPVAGELTLPVAATSGVRWHGAAPAVVSTEGTTSRFTGEIATDTTSEVTVVLPADAVPNAPLLPGASRVTSYEDRQAPLDAADRRIAGDIKNDKTREDLEANIYWGAVGLEVAIPFLITLLVLWRGAVVRRRVLRVDRRRDHRRAHREPEHQEHRPARERAPARLLLRRAHLDVRRADPRRHPQAEARQAPPPALAAPPDQDDQATAGTARSLP
jgi:hypothetical protein